MRWSALGRHSSNSVGGVSKMIYGRQLIFWEFQMLKSLSVVVLLALASPSLAETVNSLSASPEAPTAKAKDPKRKICEPVEETGSRLSSKRICMTAEQWEAQNRNNRTAGKRADKAAGERGGY